MPAQPLEIEAILQQLVAASQSYASGFMQSLPLRDADIAEINRALLASPEQCRKLADLQQSYLQQWVSILNDAGQQPDPGDDDRRFSSPEWTELPWFKVVRRLYQLNSEYVNALAAVPDVTPETKRRLQFFSRQFIDAMSPANSPITNPQSITRAIRSGGESLARGAKTFAADLARGRISMTDESAFEPGRNLAVTPGDVIFENELIQLLQYRARTKQVSARPLLIVPPFINKYYILDLRPENSFVRYCVEQGVTTFMISWRNVSESLGHLTWDDYMAMGVFEAIDAVRNISGADSLNALGYCVGGTLLASALAVKEARNEHPIHSLSLLASMLDFCDTGEIRTYVDEAYVRQCEQEFAEGGIVAGSQLTNAFSSLRANELVWHFVVNNYLLGKAPPAFDLLYWNTDSANLPGPLYAYYLRNMYLENRLRIPGSLHMQDTPVNLGAITIPAMVVAAREDHIVPWRTAYRSAGLLRGSTEFVLAASGHVAGIINPPRENRRRHWVADNGALAQTPESWLAAAREVEGSWWQHWLDWLQRRSGDVVAAPAGTGNERYQPIEAAPGRYVLERHELTSTITNKYDHP